MEFRFHVRALNIFFKGKREHVAKVNIEKLAYPSQRIDDEIPNCFGDHVIVPGTIEFTFNLDIDSTDKTRSITQILITQIFMINIRL